MLRDGLRPGDAVFVPRAALPRAAAAAGLGERAAAAAAAAAERTELGGPSGPRAARAVVVLQVGLFTPESIYKNARGLTAVNLQ